MISLFPGLLGYGKMRLRVLSSVANQMRIANTATPKDSSTVMEARWKHKGKDFRCERDFYFERSSRMLPLSCIFPKLLRESRYQILVIPPFQTSICIYIS